MKKAKTKSAAALFSGGKDSCLALFKAIEQGFDVKYLLSVLPSSYDSYMYHKPSLVLLKMQAKMLGIPLLIQKSSAGKEKELEDLKKLINKIKGKVDHLIIGGIASNYQGKRIKKIAEETGMKVVAPLWNFTPKKLWLELLKNKFEIIISKISCDGLNKEWLGKIIGKKELLELEKLSKKYKFDLSFEGGDAETTALYCPLFKKKIKIKTKMRSEGQYRHFLVVERILN